MAAEIGSKGYVARCRQRATAIRANALGHGKSVPHMEKPVVLVVEDEALIRLQTADAIADAGFEVLEAADADAAIAMLETRSDIRVVFTDVHMPGSMDGLRLVQIIRDRWPPVLLIVTSGKAALRDADLPAGGRFIPKPYDDDQVINTIRALVA
jgi:two-component system, response regulator PdtaR